MAATPCHQAANNTLYSSSCLCCYCSAIIRRFSTLVISLIRGLSLNPRLLLPSPSNGKRAALLHGACMPLKPQPPTAGLFLFLKLRPITGDGPITLQRPLPPCMMPGPSRAHLRQEAYYQEKGRKMSSCPRAAEICSWQTNTQLCRLHPSGFKN